jgi:LysR family transcriptional regulator, malonate utilization transcriptional regulator
MLGHRQRVGMHSGGNGSKISAACSRMFDPVPRDRALKIAALHQALAVQCVADTCSRTNAGIVIFVAVWLVICLIGGLWSKAPTVVLAHTLLLSAIAAMRVVLVRRLPRLMDEDPIKANMYLVLAILLNGGYWGSIGAHGVLAGWGGDVWWVLVTAAVAAATTGAMVMAINPALRLAYPAIALLPMFVAGLLGDQLHHQLMVGLAPIVYLYLIRSSSVVSNDYWATVMSRVGAEEKAQAMEVVSKTDALTQVQNRRSFEWRLVNEWDQAASAGSALSLLMVDIDHFKSINDTHGHPFGDQCLKAVAQTLNGSMRTSGDAVFRYGGEEFAVLLPKTNLHGAQVMAERLLAQIRAMRVDRGGDAHSLTCSIGIAEAHPAVGQDPRSLLQRADQALYRAKQGGRDRAAVLPSKEPGTLETQASATDTAQSIRIGSLYSLTSGTVPSLIMALNVRQPELQAELILGSNVDLVQKLRNGFIDAAVFGLPEGAEDLRSEPLFEDNLYFAAPADSPYALQASVDLASCADEKFVSLQQGFATQSRFADAFAVAGFEPQVVMTTNDIFSLMHLVGGGMGCSLLPGRVRTSLPPTVRLIPLEPRFAIRQTISLSFLRTRERDPNLLALLDASRTLRIAPG